MKKTLKTMSLLVVMLLALCMGSSVFAAGGNGSGGGGGNGGGGNGDGSGGNSSEPLALVTSTPADGNTAAVISGPIKLEFNKNVANAAVKDANIASVVLYKGDTPIAAEVTVADDQVEPDQKNFMVITPSAALESGTDYTIKIASTLTAKSGAALEAEKVIHFKTAGTAPTVQAKAAEPSAVAAEPIKAAGVNPVVYVIVGIIAVAVIIAIVVFVKKKKA